MKKLLSLMALFVVSMLAISMVSASSSDLGDLTENDITVKVNGEEEDPSALLVVEKGETLDIEVKIAYPSEICSWEWDGMTWDYVCEDNEDAEMVEVEAKLIGYEFADHEDLTDSTYVDVKAGTKETVDLEITVPEDFESGSATLKVLFIADERDFVVDYTFHVEAPEHAVSIDDVAFSPGNTVKAGRSLQTSVLLKNNGGDDEDVKVTVAVPELGVSATEYVEVDADDKEAVSEMLLFTVPATADEGDYEVVVTARLNKYDSVTETFMLHVLADEKFQAVDRLVLAAAPGSQTVGAGKTATYAVALTNEGTSSRAYTLEAVTGDWATTSLSDSLVVLESGKNQIVYVDVTVAADAAEGDHVVSLAVMSNGEVLENVVLEANVVANESGNQFSLRNGLEIALIVLVVLLVLIGLIVGFSRLRKDEEEEEQTYY